MAQINYRTINIDVLDPESFVNFPMETLLPPTLPAPTTSSEAANVAAQVRQLLRSGDPEGALRAVLDTAPLGGDDRAKEVHLATVIEVLQGIRQGEMTKVLEGVCNGQGGSERADCLMKYLYVFLFLTLCLFCLCCAVLFDGSVWLIVILGTREWRPLGLAAVRNRLANRSPRRTPDSRRFRLGTLAKVVVVSK